MSKPDMDKIRRQCEQASPHSVMASAVSPKQVLALLDTIDRLRCVVAELVYQIEADHEHLMGDHEGFMDSPEIADLLKKARVVLSDLTVGDLPG